MFEGICYSPDVERPFGISAAILPKLPPHFRVGAQQMRGFDKGGRLIGIDYDPGLRLPDSSRGEVGLRGGQ